MRSEVHPSLASAAAPAVRRADPRQVISIDERRPAPRPGRGARLAMAAGTDRLVVVRLGRGVRGPRVDEVMRYDLAAADPAALREGLQGLAEELGAGGRMDVALGRRMAHAKVVPLPPVRRAELGTLLRRNARRHFAVRDEPLVADALRMRGLRSGPLAPALAACAPASVVQSLADAADAAGFRVGRMVPAAVALAEAVRARVPRARRGRVAAVACVPGAPELVLLHDGAVRRVQPLPGTADPVLLARSIAAALREGAEDGVPADALLVLGDAGDGADAVRYALDVEGGAPPQLLDGGLDGLPAEAVLALGAALARESAPSLLPDAIVAARARAARRRTGWLAAAAAVLLVIAAAAHLSGVRAEVDAVRARRAEIAPQVRKALDARAGVTELRERLRVLSALEANAPAWTEQMAALARALPDSAWLRTLTADSAGLRMAGVARSVSTVIPALEASPRFGDVGLAAPIRWEAGDTGERFEVSASLQSDPKSATPAATPTPEAKP